jgi:hypothetical protein
MKILRGKAFLKHGILAGLLSTYLVSCSKTEPEAKEVITPQAPASDVAPMPAAENTAPSEPDAPVTLDTPTPQIKTRTHDKKSKASPSKKGKAAKDAAPKKKATK